jgi:crotonobetainyl-CoA:carnitine CoA-transferase CaiB-like acyl-CoA transferase
VTGQPLGDIRVIAVEQYAAGPYGTLHLADLGADVIKIEPPGGDVGRHVPPYTIGNDSLFFQSLNRNKRSVGLDIASPAGREVLRDLVAHSDGVYSNLRGDVPRKLGITYLQLKDVNPQIVCCSLSGYGMTGPRAAQAGYDYMIQGLAGWMNLTGEPDSTPTKTGLSVVDFSAGLASALALIVGIHAARRDGVGCDCDTSLFEVALSMLNYQATWHLSAGFVPAKVARSSHPTLVPFGMFPTADGWIVAGGSKEKFWRRMVSVLGAPELIADPRFTTFQTRLENREVLLPLLDELFRAGTTAMWIERLEQGGVPVAPINTVAEALSDPQVRDREAVFEQHHPSFGPVGQVASPVRVGNERPPRRLAPELGADTWDVLTELLGYDTLKIETLIDDGIVTASASASAARTAAEA